MQEFGKRSLDGQDSTITIDRDSRFLPTEGVTDRGETRTQLRVIEVPGSRFPRVLGLRLRNVGSPFKFACDRVEHRVQKSFIPSAVRIPGLIPTCYLVRGNQLRETQPQTATPRLLAR